MIKLTTAGNPVWLNPLRVETIGANPKGGAFVYFPGDDARLAVIESPAEVARLIAEATRPAAGVDLEAVETARRVLIALTGNPLDLYDVLGVPAGNADAMIASVRNLAARLGGTP